jgi:hypothetical protein
MSDSSVRPASSVLQFPQRNTAPLLALVFAIIFLVAQLWLLTQAIEAALQEEISLMLPTVIGSGLCFVGAWGLWRTVQRSTRRLLPRRVQQEGKPTIP